MGTNLVTLRRMVRDRLGIPAGDSFFSDSVLDTNINLAVASFDSEMRWPWNEVVGELALESGVNPTKLPEDWSAMKAVVAANGDVLEQMPAYDRARFDYPSSEARAFYAVVNRNIYHAPGPGAASTLTLYYFTEPSMLEEDDDMTACPSQHVLTIVAKACQLSAVREGERSESTDHFTEYLAGVGRARKEVNRSSTRGVGRRIRPGAFL